MKVKFLPQDVDIEIGNNQSVLDLARENGIEIKSICNGMPSCAECRVKVVEGEYNLLPPSNKELSLIGTGYFIDRRRLSCQMLCFGDVTVDLTEQVAKADAGPRRPQGAVAKTEEQESFAVAGNLIDEAGGMAEIADEPDVEPDKEPRSATDFYKGLKGNTNSQNKSADGKKKSRSGRRRRGGRNRNKKV